MIEFLRAENFRCFKELSVSGLRRVNVVVGKNAAGKTALLEAVRLALGATPNVLWGMNANRGFIGGFAQPLTREIFESLWSPYFFNFETSQAIATECHDAKGRHAKAKIFFDVKSSVTVVAQQQPQPQGVQGVPVIPSSFIPPLAFERTDFSGASSTLHASVQQQGQLNFENGPELGSTADFFSAGWAYNPIMPAQLFSQLSLQRREKAIIDAVRNEFEPSLESLSVLSPNPTPQPGLYASLQYLREKLPIGFLSSGISRFIMMLSAVQLRGQGVVLIDEIENGISYKIFPSLWKYLLRFAAENDTQIFASTHSQECVHGLLPSLSGHEEDFTLLRAERVNGSSGVTVVPGALLESAIDQGVEVR